MSGWRPAAPVRPAQKGSDAGRYEQPSWKRQLATVGLASLIVAVAMLLSHRKGAPGSEGAAPRAPPQLAPQVAEGRCQPESQNGAKADDSHDDPPHPGRKTIHGVLSPA